MTLSFQFVVSYYGQDTEGFNMFLWNGVRMNGLPVVSGFAAERTEEQARDLWMKDAYLAFGLTSKPHLTVASGNSGWTTVETGWNLIAQPQAPVIWEVSTDSPSVPEPNAPNEAVILLMVAHPGYATGRKPLVYFTAPQVVPVQDAQRQEGEAPRIAALRQAVQQVCAAAGFSPKDIGSLATDCGRHSPAAAKWLAEVSAALHDIAPQWADVPAQRIDMVALLGGQDGLGANTVNYTLLLAAYAAYERNHPVLYLSNVDPVAGRAMLVLPPLGHQPPDPHRTYREHNYRGQWYAPWWGQRLDGKKDY